MTLIFPGNIELNPGLFNRHQIKKENFKVFNNEGFHFMHLSINSLLNNIPQKMKYSTKDFFTANLVTFTEEILNGKLHF